MGFGKATGYHHSRRIQRMSQDSSIRNTNMTEVGMGLVALLGMFVPFIFLVMWLID
jgi:hypothetical protein